MTAPVYDIRIGDVIVRKQPPVLVRFCKPPDSKNCRDTVCVFKSAACDGPTITCPECDFPRCKTHHDVHRRKLTFPRDVWDAIAKRIIDWHKAIGRNARSRPRVATFTISEEPEASA